jgi:excisionase family DNA binding protein
MPEIRDPKLTMTVEEAAGTLGVSRWLAYEMAEIGELPTLRCGRRLLVPVRRLLELLGMTWDEWLAIASVAAEEVAERPRRLAVVGREEVAVDVERGGDVAVTEPATDRRDGRARRAEVRGDEVAKVVEADGTGANLRPPLDEPVGDDVWSPLLFEVGVDEHECVRR